MIKYLQFWSRSSHYGFTEVGNFKMNSLLHGIVLSGSITSCSSRIWQCIGFLVWVPHCPYLFAFIQSQILQSWCLSGVSINLAVKNTTKNSKKR